MKLQICEQYGRIPDFPRPHPQILGTERGRGQGLEKFWGFLGDGDGFDFEFFWGSIPKNPQKTGMGTGIEPLKGLGILWGRGRLNLWGFFGGKSPKNLKKRGGDGGRILGDFAHPSDLRHKLQPKFDLLVK